MTANVNVLHFIEKYYTCTGKISMKTDLCHTILNEKKF